MSLKIGRTYLTARSFPLLLVPIVFGWTNMSFRVQNKVS